MLRQNRKTILNGRGLRLKTSLARQSSTPSCRGSPALSPRDQSLTILRFSTRPMLMSVISMGLLVAGMPRCSPVYLDGDLSLGVQRCCWVFHASICTHTSTGWGYPAAKQRDLLLASDDLAARRMAYCADNCRAPPAQPSLDAAIGTAIPRQLSLHSVDLYLYNTAGLVVGSANRVDFSWHCP